MAPDWFWKRQSLNLPETWKAIAAQPLDGDQPIVPAKVGAVKPLLAKRAHEHEFLKLLKRRA